MYQYRFMCDIKFNGKKFKVFSNDNFVKTFLEVLDDNSLTYTQFEDYVKLNKIYNINYSDVLFNLKNYKFKPGAFYKGKYIAVGALSVIIGLLNTSSSTNYKTNYEKFLSVLEQQEISDLPSEEQFLDMIGDNKIEFANDELNNQVEFYESNGIRWVHSFGNTIYVQDNDEFRKYVENPYPTFGEVREAINNNLNIDNEVKMLLHKYIDSVENKYPNIDLVCFYHNVKRLSVKYTTKEKLNEMNATAYYNRNDGFICFLEGEKIDEYSAFHEFTHMLTESEIIKDDKNIIKSCSGFVLENGTNNILQVGNSYIEGVDEVFLKNVFGEKNVLSYVSYYKEYIDIVSYFCDLGFSITDMAEFNIRYIIDGMEKYGIKDIKHIIELMDLDVFSKRSSSDIELETDLRMEIYSIFFENYVNKKLEEGIDKNQIYFDVVSLLENGFIQRNYGYSTFFPEQQMLIQNTLNEVCDLLNINDKISEVNDKLVGDYFYIDFNNSDYNIKCNIYYAVTDDMGNIKVYERFTNNEVSVDLRYGEFFSILKDEGIVTWNDNCGFNINTYDVWDYLKNKIMKENNISMNNLYLVCTSDNKKMYYYTFLNDNGEMEYWDYYTLKKTIPVKGKSEYVNVLIKNGVMYINDEGEFLFDSAKFDQYFSNDSYNDEAKLKKYLEKQDEIKEINKSTENLIYINKNLPDNPIEIYLGKKDLNGDLLAYDRYSYNLVDIDKEYCEFVSVLKENGFLTIDELSGEINILDKNEFIKYCETKKMELDNENSSDVKDIVDENIIKNEDGSYVVSVANSKLDVNRYNYYKNSIKLYDSIMYFYDVNNNLIKIEASSKINDNNNKLLSEEKVIFFPNGNYSYNFIQYDLNSEVCKKENITYDYNEKLKNIINRTKNEDSNFDEIVTIYDENVTSPYVFDGYMEKGDYIYRRVNGEVVVKEIDGVIYKYVEPEHRDPRSEDYFLEAYSVSVENGLTTYHENGIKEMNDNKKGLTTVYNGDGSIFYTLEESVRKFYYDYENNIIESIFNMSDFNKTFNINGKIITLGPDEMVSFTKDGLFSSMSIDVMNDISRGTDFDKYLQNVEDVLVNHVVTDLEKNAIIKIEYEENGNGVVVSKWGNVIHFYRNNDFNCFYVYNISKKTYTFYQNNEIIFETKNSSDFKIIQDEQCIQRVQLNDGTIIDSDYQSEFRTIR